MLRGQKDFGMTARAPLALVIGLELDVSHQSELPA